MGIAFTEKQQEVIDIRGCNLLVSAAAGSGKTAVLVERIVKMVSDGAEPVDIDRLLVVTFTNAAAAEMRERISRALNDRLAADPENEHLQKQTTLLHNARITTIDSFCLFVLRNQFHTIGLDPGFRIAEEGEGKLLRQEALEEVLEAGYAAAEPDFLHCMEYFGAGSRDTAVEEMVLKLYDFAMSTPFPEQWLEERKRDYCVSDSRGTRAEKCGEEDCVSDSRGAGAEKCGEEECVSDSRGVGAKEHDEEDCAAGNTRTEVCFEEMDWVRELLRQTRLILQGCAEKLTEAVRLCEEPDGPYMYGELLEREKEMVEGLLRKCGCSVPDHARGMRYDGTEDGTGDDALGDVADCVSDNTDIFTGPGTYDALYTAFETVKFDRLPSKKDETVSPVKREAAKAVRTAVKEQLGDLQKRYFFKSREQVLAQMEVCRAAVEALVDLTLAFKETFDGKKRDKNLLDFDDIEHFALSILVRRDEAGNCVPTETALEYRSHFHEILIDEYQDSNLVQEYILSCISREAEGRYNRFMVGDVKQSIYKFRLARPELFLEKYAEYGEEDAEASAAETGKAESQATETAGQRRESRAGGKRRARKIDLHQNFRSREEVLNVTNRIFEQIMGQDVGGIVYDDLAALHPGAVYPVQEYGVQADGAGNGLPGHDPNAAELLLFAAGDKPDEIMDGDRSRSPAEDGLTGGPAGRAAAGAPDGSGNGQSGQQAGGEGKQLTAKEQEAYGVAAKIRELLRTFQVTDKGSGTLRNVSYRDIVILLRTASGWDEVFKRVLEEEGIPVHMTSRTGYFAAGEVQELLHFLRVLDNPLQDIPLYGVLHAYLGGFAEEEIALLRAAFPREPYLYDAVRSCAENRCPDEEDHTMELNAESVTRQGTEQSKAGQETLRPGHPLPPALIQKARRFLERIDHYRGLAVYLSVQELLQTILRETDYLNYVAVKPEGGRRRANVEMLLVKAAEYEKTSYFGLYHFLRYMEQLEKYEVDYGEAALQDENADVVRIMSIHKSKGLEFPVCFVCGLGKSFRTRDAGEHLVLDIDAGIGVDYVNPDLRVCSRDLRRNVLAGKMKADNLAEELRILYVAMTRAREKLILTGTVKTPEKLAASLMLLWHREELLLPYDVLLDRGSFLDLLLHALARNRCMDGFYRACGLEPVQSNPLYGQDMSIEVILSDWEGIVEEKLEETIRLEERKRSLLLSDPDVDVDAVLMTRLSESFVYHYPYENLRNLYTKTTVSELKMAGMLEETDFSFKLYEEETVVPYLPGFLEKDERVSGSMRGSAFHKVMELLDFTKVTKEVNSDKRAAEDLVKRQLEQMRRDGRLSEDFRTVVSIPKIVAFLMSDAAFRMGEAARAGRLYKEQPFVLGLPADRLSQEFPHQETVLIQGIIDVFFEENGKYVLLDYKTDAVKTAQELIGCYHVQLEYYAEALEQHSDYRDTEKILYSFKLGQEIRL